MWERGRIRRLREPETAGSNPAIQTECGVSVPLAMGDSQAGSLRIAHRKRDADSTFSLDGWIRTSGLRLPKPADSSPLPHPEKNRERQSLPAFQASRRFVAEIPMSALSPLILTHTSIGRFM